MDKTTVLTSPRAQLRNSEVKDRRQVVPQVSQENNGQKPPGQDLKMRDACVIWPLKFNNHLILYQAL